MVECIPRHSAHCTKGKQGKKRLIALIKAHSLNSCRTLVPPFLNDLAGNLFDFLVVSTSFSNNGNVQILRLIRLNRWSIFFLLISLHYRKICSSSETRSCYWHSPDADVWSFQIVWLDFLHWLSVPHSLLHLCWYFFRCSCVVDELCSTGDDFIHPRANVPRAANSPHQSVDCFIQRLLERSAFPSHRYIF